MNTREPERASRAHTSRNPRHAHAFLDTLVAPYVTIDGAITVLRGAQAAFLLDGTLLDGDMTSLTRKSRST